ncbi:unnamed protein product [Effrenium voratum]|nr:unnamed protein product [Effrenium voratum]
MHGHDEPDPGKRQPQVEPSQEPSASAGEGIRIDYDSGWADRLFDFMDSRNSAEYNVTARAGQQLQWQVNGGPGELQSTPSPEQFPLLIEKKAGDGTQGFGLQHVLVYPRPSLLAMIFRAKCFEAIPKRAHLARFSFLMLHEMLLKLFGVFDGVFQHACFRFRAPTLRLLSADFRHFESKVIPESIAKGSSGKVWSRFH